MCFYSNPIAAEYWYHRNDRYFTELTPSGSYDPNAQASGSSQSRELVVAEKKIPKMPCYVRKAIDRNRNFVGRSAIIKQIDQALLPNSSNLSSGLRSFSLCGFGGLGKTQIATYYAFARESDFDAIFWVQADEIMKLNKSFNEIAKALDLVEEGDQGNKAISRDKVLQWFSDPRKRAMRKAASLTDMDSALAKWLIIFDNADNISILREFWPLGSSGSILVTSRDPTAKSDLANQGIDLPPMSSDECAALLQSLIGEAPSATPSHAALFLANRVGNVPLAISQIATRIRRNAMTIEEFLNRHGNDSLLLELNKEQSQPPQEHYRHTLATVWGFENFSPKAQGLINTMVFMDPDNIAEFILWRDTMDIGSIPYPKPEDEYERAWEEIYRTSLVQRKKETKTLSWHREVQDVAKSTMTNDQQQKYYEHTIDILSRAWTYADEPFTRENFKQSACDDVLPHIQSIFRIYESPLTNFEISTSSARKLVKLLQEAGWLVLSPQEIRETLMIELTGIRYLVQSAQYDPVLPMFNLAMSISQSHGDTMKDLLADTAFSLARYGEETNMNPHKVFEYCDLYHRLSKELNDGSTARVQNLATSHTSLAQAYLLLDNYDKAAEHCNKCIAIEDDFPDHKSGAWMSQFAHIYLAWAEHGMKNYAKAIALASKVIGFRMRTFGPDDTESIKSFFNEAIRIFSATSYYSPELARALYKKYQFSVSLDTGSPNDTTPILENLIYKEAAETYHRLCPQADQTTPLNALDFDSLVRFWSR
ncbi:P-loop containing nucleoside triphosphate hydrolase protein [Trichoderma chlorosporum]